MPPPRKIDLLPQELRSWLQEELRARGFGQYEELAEALNFRLEEAGLDLRIRKSAIHAWGSEYQEFVRLQEQASDWAKEWLGDMGMEDQAQRQNVLFQMLTTLAFKVMQAEVAKEGVFRFDGGLECQRFRPACCAHRHPCSGRGSGRS